MAQDFPYESFWEYCCECKTFWPGDPVSGGRGRDACPVCERRISLRYLCNNCKVLTVGGDKGGRGMLAALIAGGESSPPCPGCLKVSSGARATHQCPDAAIEFASALPSCPICDEPITGEAEVAPQTKRSLEFPIPVPQAPTEPAPAKIIPEHRPARRRAAPPEVTTTVPHAPFAVDIAPTVTGNGARSRPTAAAETATATAPGVAGLWRGRSLRIIIAGLIVSSLVLIYFVAVMWRLRTQTGEEGKNGQRQTTPTMAYVPGGEFLMGANNSDQYEQPQHKVIIKPFYIDLYEVTCEEYQQFVRATGHAPPQTWKNGQYPQGAARWPVTGVTWDDAVAYAKWVKKRLPSEEEWELAARGSDGRRYPWGNDWKREAANADADSKGRFTDVGSYPSGASPFGLFDMSGNAWEWTASPLTAYPGGQLPQQSTTDEMRVIRGGFWGSPQNKATVTFRRGWPARGDYDYKNTGFRCASDAQ